MYIKKNKKIKFIYINIYKCNHQIIIILIIIIIQHLVKLKNITKKIKIKYAASPLFMPFCF